MPLSTLPFPAKASAHLWQTLQVYAWTAQTSWLHRLPTATLRLIIWCSRFCCILDICISRPWNWRDAHGPLKPVWKCAVSQDELKLKAEWKNTWKNMRLKLHHHCKCARLIMLTLSWSATLPPASSAADLPIVDVLIQNAHSSSNPGNLSTNRTRSQISNNAFPEKATIWRWGYPNVSRSLVGDFCPRQATRVHGTSLVSLNESLAQIIVTLAFGNKMKADQRQPSQKEWFSSKSQGSHHGVFYALLLLFWMYLDFYIFVPVLPCHKTVPKPPMILRSNNACITILWKPLL